MSRKSPSATTKLQSRALAFAALGDPMRLTLVMKLCDGRAHSIANLTENSRLTRQAITKHLRVLERVGMVRSAHSGRESLFRFEPAPLDNLKEYLDVVSRQWDLTLGRLKALVETSG